MLYRKMLPAVVVFVFIVTQPAFSEPYRRNKLAIVSILPRSTPDGTDVCRTAHRIAVEHVNQRDDILPGFEIVIDFQDETANSMLATRQTIEFQRRFENRLQNSNATTYPAPIILGPLYTSGCKAFNGLAPSLGLVNVVQGCLSPIFTANRHAYPNSYRLRVPAELTALATLAFVKEIGSWSSIAIYALSANPYNAYIGAYLYEKSYAAGVSVAWMDFIISVTDGSMQSLKESDVRIVAVETVDSSEAFTFLCKAYRLGMKGSRYVFIIPLTAYPDPTKATFQGDVFCSESVLREQFRSLLFLGDVLKAVDYNGPSSLGYTPAEFDEMLDKRINPALRKTTEYEMRHLCHDQMMIPLLALDSAERTLNSRNASLTDFMSRSDEIMQVVNASVANVNATTLLYGSFKYSERLEVDDQPVYVSQWSSEAGFQLMFRYRRFNKTSDVNSIKSYVFSKLPQGEHFRWSTPDGRPPRDSALFKNETMRIPTEALATNLAINIGAIIGFVFTNCVTWIIRKAPSAKGTLPRSRLIFVNGCIILCLSSISSLLDASDTICIARLVLTVVGLCLVNCYLVSRLIIARRHLAKVLPRRSPIWKSPAAERKTPGVKSGRTAKLSPQKPAEQPVIITAIGSEDEGLLLIICKLFLVISILILIVWFVIERPIVRVMPVTLHDYDPVKDTLTDLYVKVCYSSLDTVFMVVLASMHVILFAFGSVLALYMWKDIKELAKQPESGASDLKLVVYTMINASATFGCTFFVTFITSKMPLVQQGFMSFALHGLAAVTAMVLFAPHLKSNLKLCRQILSTRNRT